MMYNALTQMTARSLDRGKYADGQGLWLVKRDKQFGKWMLRLVVSGKRREMGLGRWPDVSIAEARERAAGARKQVRDGLDPIVDRQKTKRVVKRLTLKEAIDGCFEARKAELKRDGDAGRWMSPLKTHNQSIVSYILIDGLRIYHILGIRRIGGPRPGALALHPFIHALAEFKVCFELW